MNAHSFPAVAIIAAALTVSICFAATATGQESSPGSTAPLPQEASPAPVYLSSGASDILKLSRAKISDEVTVAFVQTGDRRYNLTASEILYLRKEGVSDRVLTAMLGQQSSPASTTPAPTPVPAPAMTAEASAPQYTTPPETTVVETVPASTVYVATTPTYYSFYDPWPYWSSWFAYPSLTFGLYWGSGWGWGWGWGWGSCSYGYWGYPYCYNGYRNNYCHNGYYPPPHYGNPPPPSGNRPPPPSGNPTPRGNPGTSGRPEGLVSTEGRQPANLNSASTARGLNRVDNQSASATTTSARPTSVWNNNGNQRTAARTSEGESRIASSRVGQTAATASVSRPGADNRVATARPVESRVATQPTVSGRSSIPTRTWSSGASQRPTARTSVSQPAAVVAPSRIGTAPSTTYSRSTSPAATRYVSSRGAGYQGSSAGPTYSNRGGGSLSSVSRPSMSPSFGGAGNRSAFQGGGGFSGGGAPRMSSGGGFHGGGAGGGGGGRHR